MPACTNKVPSTKKCVFKSCKNAICAAGTRSRAWANQGEDAKIIAAMKKGAKAKLTARSSRGTRTEDTFSLLGFTAAVEDADKRCK
ncbi:MAG: hypothetical protein EBZ20_12735 [Rhodobacteraceae bacterium]|nr:hypothetical protein [Paracoccaceae bacterium]